ncbi:SANT/Myb domain [Dillenia turbinata]|uniref:SANT/Myb domain n=1 Tax=Dillenia turbinata TaxID=194707 RepID=A0AAN8Z0D2_9MAGN
MMNYTDNLQRCKEYCEALEEERKKIQVFHRELPLCLQLVTQAIEACKQQLSTTSTENYGQSECSEQTSSDGPVIEEYKFIPIKRTSSFDEEEQLSNKSKKNNVGNEEKSTKKSDWLKSVQLWNESPDRSPDKDSPRKGVVEVKKNGGAFHPFTKENKISGISPQTATVRVSNSTATSSTVETANATTSTGGGGGGGGRKEEKEGQSQRKPRRCWSPELHRRFLHALQQLGGAHVATPKQIRELMKVDGLTNDEVKSHLQKYRLHTRRPSPAMASTGNPHPPQFVVVGGIWVPPPEYAAVAATTTGETTTIASGNGIYAPVATPALPVQKPSPSGSLTISNNKQQQKQSHSSNSEERSHSDNGVHSNSPATSSSTHTTTASPAF